MLKPNLNNHQKAIIRDICNKQTQSLIRVAIIEPQADEKISDLLISFDNLRLKPSRLLQLDNDSLSLFKHNLFNVAYSSNRLNEAISNIWRQLNINEYFKSIPQ